MIVLEVTISMRAVAGPFFIYVPLILDIKYMAQFDWYFQKMTVTNEIAARG